MDLFGGTYTTELRLWEAIDDLLLAPFEYVGVDDGTDLTRLGWHQGDYAIGELSNLYTGDHERVKLIVQAISRWVEHPQTMRALGFCVSVDHAKFMAAQFNERGISADYLSGDHDQDHRKATLARLTAGELQVVFSVEVLGEGVDVPDVDTLLLLRPTQSATLFSQQLGRGLRATPRRRAAWFSTSSASTGRSTATRSGYACSSTSRMGQQLSRSRPSFPTCLPAAPSRSSEWRGSGFSRR